MRIIVRDDETHIDLIFPSALIFSRLGTKLISSSLSKKQGESNRLSDYDLKRMAEELNRFRKKHRGWVLADVTDSGGGRILIKL